MPRKALVDPKKELSLCGAHPREWSNYEPCPLEKGHEGKHVFWQQTRPNSAHGRNGVMVYDEDGEAVAHMTFEGSVTAEEMCAMLWLLDHAARKPLDAP